jgi:hypothetical protein
MGRHASIPPNKDTVSERPQLLMSYPCGSI